MFRNEKFLERFFFLNETFLNSLNYTNKIFRSGGAL